MQVTPENRSIKLDKLYQKKLLSKNYTQVQYAVTSQFHPYMHLSSVKEGFSWGDKNSLSCLCIFLLVLGFWLDLWFLALLFFAAPFAMGAHPL